MKLLTGIILAGLVIGGDLRAQAFKAPDILIDSKLDYDWSRVVITKFRTLLKNNNMNDPFKARFAQPILVNESEIGSLLPNSSKELIRDFGNAVGLNIVRGETKVWMHGFSYDVKGFKTNLRGSSVQKDGLVLGTDFSASEVTLSADKITIGLVIPGTNNSPIFNVDIIRPYIRAEEERLINFFAQIKIQDNKDFYQLQIQKANFDQMAKGLVASNSDIDLDYDRIIIPEVSIRVGNRTVNFSPDRVENLIRQNHEAVKGILLAQVAKTLQANTSQAAFKVLEQYQINKEYWVESDVINSQIMLAGFSTSKTGDNIEINMPGDFCTDENYDQFKKHCVYNKKTKTADTRITSSKHDQSIKIIKDMMARDDADIVASISEDYLNKLLVTTYDAGLWKDALDEAGVELGPNKVIMRMDRQGDSGTLLMDMIYKPGRLERVVTGSKEIRFPLVLDVSVRIEKHDDEPVVIIRLNDVDTTDQTLIYGRPQDNLISTVKDARLKGTIAKTIREKLNVLKNKDLIELRYPELSGIGLEKVDFYSDGNGRMNAFMRLEDLMEDGTEF
jgi:hypothetical protein